MRFLATHQPLSCINSVKPEAALVRFEDSWNYITGVL
jgi:hypothetical protein